MLIIWIKSVRAGGLFVRLHRRLWIAEQWSHSVCPEVSHLWRKNWRTDSLAWVDAHSEHVNKGKESECSATDSTERWVSQPKEGLWNRKAQKVEHRANAESLPVAGDDSQPLTVVALFSWSQSKLQKRWRNVSDDHLTEYARHLASRKRKATLLPTGRLATSFWATEITLNLRWWNRETWYRETGNFESEPTTTGQLKSRH